DGLWRGRPGKAQARRKIGAIWKARVVIPADSQVQRQFLRDAPVVLEKPGIIVIAQPDQVIRRGRAAHRPQTVNARVDRPELAKVGHSGEQLIQNVAGLHAVDEGALEVPAELDSMPPDDAIQVGSGGGIFLIEAEWREARP